MARAAARAMLMLLGASLLPLAEGAIGEVEFVIDSMEVHERDEYHALSLVRVGGASGDVVAIVGVIDSGTAVHGEDYEMAWTPILFVNGSVDQAVSVRILDDAPRDVFEEEKFFVVGFAGVDPPEARGTAHQNVTIVIRRDDDGGRLELRPASPRIRETSPVGKQCVLWANRTGGSSGNSSLRLEATSCPAGNEEYHALAGIDYKYLPAIEAVSWGDGEGGARCALWHVGRDAQLGDVEGGLYVYRDAEDELDEFVCFEPVLENGSTATLGDDVVEVLLQDLGAAGGDALNCVKGHPCTLSWDLQNSTLANGDVLIFTEGDCGDTCSRMLESFGGMYINTTDRMVSFPFSRDDFANIDPGVTTVCICRPGAGEVTVHVSSISIYGPHSANRARCTLGRSRCIIPMLLGKYEYGAFHQSAGARRHELVRVLAACGIGANTSHQALLAVARAEMRNEYMHDGVLPGQYVIEDEGVLTETPAGLYRLCWCRVSAGTTCEDLEQFVVDAGILVLAGPQNVGELPGAIGQPFALRRVYGVGLSLEDVVRMQRRCGDNGGKYLEAPVESDLLTYDFGVLSNALISAGMNELCWCQREVASGVFCNRSQDFRARFGAVRLRCPPYTVNFGGTCGDLRPFERPDEARENAILDGPLITIAVFSVLLGTAAFCLLVAQLALYSKRGLPHLALIGGRRIFVEDISPEQGRVIVTTRHPHGLAAGWRVSVAFLGTGHFRLDDTAQSRKSWTVLAAGPRRLEILDAQGSPPAERADASMGVVVLSAPATLRHSVFFGRAPVVLVALLVWVASLCLFLVTEDSRRNGYFLAACVPLEISVALLLVPCWRFVLHRAEKSAMEDRLAHYDRLLLEQNPCPEPCDRGPGRAVSALQLFSLFEFFREFIKDRTMYYLDPTIVRPLCARYQLSYAERVGPHRVQWFVSHFWGTEFQVFCEAVRKHAVATNTETEDGWKQSTYWICTFSNNQYRVLQELGKTHVESSFYLALRSGTCKGTCMILDELALPLTRSWCLFELLQTIQLEAQQQDFHGLLFCTSTGVLNFGAAVVELAMNIGKKLTTLSVENASATSQADKDMINALVIKEMGSFKAIDRELKQHVRGALQKCQAQVNGSFADLFGMLEQRKSVRCVENVPDDTERTGAAAEVLLDVIPDPSVGI